MGGWRGEVVPVEDGLYPRGLLRTNLAGTGGGYVVQRETHGTQQTRWLDLLGNNWALHPRHYSPTTPPARVRCTLPLPVGRASAKIGCCGCTGGLFFAEYEHRSWP